MEHIKLRLTAIYHQLIAHEVAIIHLNITQYNCLHVSVVLSHLQGSSWKGFLTPMDSYFAGTSQHQLCTVNTEDIKKVKVKESHNRPSVAQRVPGGLGSQISWHLAREGGKVVSLMHWPRLPPGMFLVLIFTRGWVDPRAMEWSEGDMSLKNPVTSPGIDHGTIRLVAQHLNHYATPGPSISWTYFMKMTAVDIVKYRDVTI